MPTCTLQGAFNTGGWVWAGTLSCDGIELRDSSAAARYTLKSKDGGPVNIAVDNCD
jgi:hypothetical protein